MTYRVVWTVTSVEQRVIEADSESDARSAWEKCGYDGELFFIEDEHGNQTFYD